MDSRAQAKLRIKPRLPSPHHPTAFNVAHIEALAMGLLQPHAHAEKRPMRPAQVYCQKQRILHKLAMKVTGGLARGDVLVGYGDASVGYKSCIKRK